MHYTRINRAVASIFDEIINQLFSRLSQMALSKLDRDLRDEADFSRNFVDFRDRVTRSFFPKTMLSPRYSSPFLISNRISKLLYRQGNKYSIKNIKKYKQINKLG